MEYQRGIVCRSTPFRVAMQNGVFSGAMQHGTSSVVMQNGNDSFSQVRVCLTFVTFQCSCNASVTVQSVLYFLKFLATAKFGLPSPLFMNMAAF